MHYSRINSDSICNIGRGQSEMAGASRLPGLMSELVGAYAQINLRFVDDPVNVPTIGQVLGGSASHADCPAKEPTHEIDW